MLEDDDKNDIHMTIKDLIPEIRNVTHAKISYLSIAQIEFGIISFHDRKEYNKPILEQTVQTTSDNDSIAT